MEITVSSSPPGRGTGSPDSISITQGTNEKGLPLSRKERKKVL